MAIKLLPGLYWDGEKSSQTPKLDEKIFFSLLSWWLVVSRSFHTHTGLLLLLRKTDRSRVINLRPPFFFEWPKRNRRGEEKISIHFLFFFLKGKQIIKEKRGRIFFMSLIIRINGDLNISGAVDYGRILFLLFFSTPAIYYVSVWFTNGPWNGLRSNHWTCIWLKKKVGILYL
jgi:hypothetical protein